uniref:Uncharacterized protein n=1 Tax=Anguilla anguilla TaxID=7936 RepID=A0A0E9Q0P4_ANGAN
MGSSSIYWLLLGFRPNCPHSFYLTC